MAKHTKSSYAAYLASNHWRRLRKEYLDEVSACERCTIPRWLAEIAYGQDLHLHHKNYANLGAEEPEDLEILCVRCHEVETFGRTEIKAPKSARCELCRATHWNYRGRLCSACELVMCTPYLSEIQFKPHPTKETIGEYILWLINRERRQK